MGQTRLDLAVFLILLILPLAHASQQSRPARPPSLPPALQDRLSPLSTQQEIYYGTFIKRGGAEAMSENILYEFCKSARLLCSTSLRESTWGTAIWAENVLSLTSESHIDRGNWANGKRSLPSTSKAGMGEVETRSLAFGKRVFIGWSPKAEKSLPSASKTGMAGEVETTSLAFDKSIFVGWSPKAEKSLPSASKTGMGEVETTSLAFDKSVFTGWSPKAEKSLSSASETGMAGRKVEPAHLFAQRWASRMGVTGIEPEGLKQHGTAKYFREKDLMVGAQLVLPHFLYQPTSHNKANAELKPSFLPAYISLYLPPFDIHHLEDLLLLFHIPFNTHMAQKMEETLKACDGQSIGKDDNDFITSLCATSFEAMLKFASSMVRAPNNKMQALTNSKVVGSVGGKVTIVRMAELAAGQDAVDCHELMFPFKVMGCHRIKESKVMVVRMADEGGVDMDLLVACHKNTTLFDPQHEAFDELRSSPGHTEICHFLPNSDIMWIPL